MVGRNESGGVGGGVDSTAEGRGVGKGKVVGVKDKEQGLVRSDAPTTVKEG